MSRVRCLAAFLLLALSVGLARADGLLCQLPKDGSWATYNLDIAVKMPNGQNASTTGTMSLASVGQVTENGMPCRWIEVLCKLTMGMGDQKAEKVQMWKLLIPEKYLAKGETPLEHVLRAWTRQGTGEPQNLADPNDMDAGPLPLVLSAPWKEAKQLDKAEVECKLGKVSCDGEQGLLEFKAKGGNAMRMKWKLENRLHADSPFGVATSRWIMSVPDMMEGEMEWNLKLIDFGGNAQSKMPDAK